MYLVFSCILYFSQSNPIVLTVLANLIYIVPYHSIRVYLISNAVMSNFTMK